MHGVCVYKTTTGLRAWQLMGNEGSNLSNGKLLCLWIAKTIETVHEGQQPNLFDNALHDQSNKVVIVQLERPLHKVWHYLAWKFKSL